MHYPAKFEKDEKGLYTVTFRDIPEAITCGDNFEDAKLMAEDALRTALEFYFDDKRIVPMPSSQESEEVNIKLPINFVAKTLLLNEMLDQRVNASDLADRMGISKQLMSRITDIKHTTRIETIEDAFEQLDREINLIISSKNKDEKKSSNNDRFNKDNFDKSKHRFKIWIQGTNRSIHFYFDQITCFYHDLKNGITTVELSSGRALLVEVKGFDKKNIGGLSNKCQLYEKLYIMDDRCYELRWDFERDNLIIETGSIQFTTIDKLK